MSWGALRTCDDPLAWFSCGRDGEVETVGGCSELYVARWILVALHVEAPQSGSAT